MFIRGHRIDMHAFCNWAGKRTWWFLQGKMYFCFHKNQTHCMKNIEGIYIEKQLR